jgi:hypothetical protein
MIIDRRFRGAYFLHHHPSMVMEAVRTSETPVDNHFTRQYNPEDNSEHHTRRRENLKSHTGLCIQFSFPFVCCTISSSLSYAPEQ